MNNFYNIFYKNKSMGFCCSKIDDFDYDDVEHVYSDDGLDIHYVDPYNLYDYKYIKLTSDND